MDSVSSGSSLQFLATLLRDAEHEDDDEHEPHTSVSTMTPASIGPVKKTTVTLKLKSQNSKTIWNTEEVPEGSEFDDTQDPREEPDSSNSIKENDPKGKQMARGVQPELLDRLLIDLGIITCAYEYRRSEDFAYTLSNSLEKYQILFKQCVGTEDVFLGMSRKDHSTACCEYMVIKIKLPDTKCSDIALDIQDEVLDLRTPKMKLLLHLPYRVNSKDCKVRFLSEEETLEITLRVSRMFDFINFA